MHHDLLWAEVKAVLKSQEAIRLLLQTLFIVSKAVLCLWNSNDSFDRLQRTDTQWPYLLKQSYKNAGCCRTCIHFVNKNIRILILGLTLC